jgi:hypothetical protein
MRRPCQRVEGEVRRVGPRRHRVARDARRGRPGRPRVRPEVRSIMEGLDARGILQSVASKNDPDEALAVLEDGRPARLRPLAPGGLGAKSAAVRPSPRTSGSGSTRSSSSTTSRSSGRGGRRPPEHPGRRRRRDR